MREGTAPSIRREDYAAPPFWIRKVDLTFDLDPAKTLVINRMQIERNADVAAGPLQACTARTSTLTRCLVNGESVSFRHEDGLLVIDNACREGSFTLEIRNTCAPEKNTQLIGPLHLGRRLLHAVRGRRLSPHHLLPRPARRDGRVHGDRCAPARRPTRCCCRTATCVEQGELDNGRHFAKLARPVPEAELPVRAGRRRPGRARAAHPLALGQGPPAAGLRARAATSTRPSTR